MKKFKLTKVYDINEKTICDLNCNNCPLLGFKFCDNIMLGTSLTKVIKDIKEASEFFNNFEIEEVENA